MKQTIKNAVVAIVGTNFEGKKSRIHLLHVGNNGEMRGAFYYGKHSERSTETDLDYAGNLLCMNAIEEIR